MKNELTIFFLGAILFSTISFSEVLPEGAMPQMVDSPIEAAHLDPEMSGREYLNYLNQHSEEIKMTQATFGISSEDPDLDRWIEAGTRNLQWVDHLNKFRDERQKLSFSSEATQTGNPVDQPRFYNFKIIAENWRILITLMPKALKEVLFGNLAFPNNLPLSEREFLEWGLQIDRAYSLTVRYKLNRPYKDQLAARKKNDVRGYLNLLGTKDLDSELANWSTLDRARKDFLAEALLMICLNNRINQSICESKFEEASKKNSILQYKKTYFPKAKENYDSFFRIENQRSDLDWDPLSQALNVPFLDPQNDPVKLFLRENIEDEFKWGPWALKLNFKEHHFGDIPHIVFAPGVTPHVDRLGGSIITMDANSPLSEYDVQWTIRHEFGHVLGLKDCYLEFYDNAVNAFVTYQLDVTNLMCSRRGHLNQGHYDELKRVYEH